MVYSVYIVCYFLFYLVFVFFFNDTATTEIYTLSLHDALPISIRIRSHGEDAGLRQDAATLGTIQFDAAELRPGRSEEHTSELQSLRHLVCRLLLEKKKTNINK